MRGIKITQSITNRQDASLGIFLKEMNKIPMISLDEEVELAKKIQNGDMAARNKLVEANLRFVVSVAKQYQNQGISLVDLIQAGVIGIMNAAIKWDHTKGFKFISYAVWWIRQAIVQTISDHSRTVRMPMQHVQLYSKLKKITEKFEQENERPPSVEELADLVDESTYKIILNKNASSKAVSLDTPFKEEEADSLIDILPNRNASEADNYIINNSVSIEIEEVLCKLSNREGDVLRMFFGLGMMPMTLEEISIRFGICTERIRQLKDEALEKIRLNYKALLKELL